MSDTGNFTGFTAAGRQFLLDLEANNNREWFEAHKSVYQDQLLTPATDFVVAMGTRLQALDPDIRIDPRTNGQGTLMRIYRDVRFSKDKTPYKTAVSGVFRAGEGKKTDAPGLGFYLFEGGFWLMAGMFAFSKEQLAAYREAVADDRSGEELVAALATIALAGPYRLGGEQSKRVPQGYDPDHPRADLLRRKGLHVDPEGGIANPWDNPNLVEDAFAHYEVMTPVYRWLKRYLP